jgi:FADH2-dependent halogenase
MKARTAKIHGAIIVGGGPAGAVTALHLLKVGAKPLILEQERFPCYHIGESLTSEVGVCLRELGLERAMHADDYPIKHGTNVHGPCGKEAFWVPVKCRDENKQLQSAITGQVRRSPFDQTLFDVAVERGADLLPCRTVAPLMESNCVNGICIHTADGATEDIKPEVVMDASISSAAMAI